MADTPDVLFGLTGDVRQNSRAIRQIDALIELGCQVDVLTFGPGVQEPWRSGVRLHVLPEPSSRGPVFFARVDGVFRRAARAIPARVYHASDLFILPALSTAARAHEGRLVYDSRELYPYVGATAGKPWSRLFWRMIEHRYIRRTDAVFTVSQSIADWLKAHYGIREPVLVYNVPVQRHVSSTRVLREQFHIPEGRPIILYQGYLKRGRGCTLLLDAMADVPDAVLVFMGAGEMESELRERVRAQQLEERVFFLGMAPPDRLLSVTASADVGACLVEDLSLSLRYALPNKLFEYLAAGLPVIGSTLPEIRRVIDMHDVGCVVDPTHRSELVRTLRHMVSDDAARARWSANTERVFETYSWEASARRFKAVYRSLLE
ncbi:MAG TPA: glycosyltransferase family 4 protein [Rhodothermales bacterium]|nr:glycosyltransferase family 4 protein [Rhodothermales bacterium]